MSREKFYPTNGNDGILIESYCEGCSNYDKPCRLLSQSDIAESEGEMPDEWTAEDCTGKGFNCSARLPPTINLKLTQEELPEFLTLPQGDRK